MKLMKPALAVLAIASSFAFAVTSNAEPIRASCRGGKGGETWPIVPQNYVTQNCAYCHGPSVQGFAVTPRLAGQHRDYILLQFDRLRNQSRNNPFSLKYMSHAAVGVQPENECEVAAYLASLPPDPARDGNEALTAQGEAIFQHGIPEANIPACAFCHGQAAQGRGQFPRLGGQSYFYLQRRLEQWGEGYNTVAEHMPGIAARLSAEQIDALASYLSFVQ
ncbi:MAG: c-type cytochrome [Rhodomicrobium sp.]